MAREVEAAGLVIRRPDAGDGRAQRVWLTGRAEQFRPAATQILEEMNAVLLGELSPRAVSSLKRSLAAIMSLPTGADAAAGVPQSAA